MTDWTPNELDLLRLLSRDIGHCIADPDHGIAHLRDSHGSGGGSGFGYRYTRTSIEGLWHEWIPIAWAPAGDRRGQGQPIHWRKGALLRSASISYPRLHRWCTALPANVREQAIAHWRTAPHNTRNLPALDNLASTLLHHHRLSGPTQPALFDIEEHTYA
ncbi:hypothetical protein [Nocardia sp. XZ_19_369]|uniref:hypothetical protein n=1 Tax=Nocardia sp. XZ_19_369 TaxID=2769487 RepID=UPI00188E077C|nr:hypothetical protein [Nocardia sp. XZ_19_369]